MAKDTATTEENMDQTQGSESLQKIMDNFVDTASVGTVYGRAVKSGDVTIIPAAEVMVGMGFGFGEGSFSPPEETAEGEPVETQADGETPQQGSGMGGGGGGYTFSRPVALVIVSPEGVRVEPVADRTKILMAALTTAGFMFGMMAKMMKSGR